MLRTAPQDAWAHEELVNDIRISKVRFQAALYSASESQWANVLFSPERVTPVLISQCKVQESRQSRHLANASIIPEWA